MGSGTSAEETPPSQPGGWGEPDPFPTPTIPQMGKVGRCQSYAGSAPQPPPAAFDITNRHSSVLQAQPKQVWGFVVLEWSG